MIRVTDLDIVFLSYDEPLAEWFFEDLRSKHPKAKHVAGVRGLDAAYKATAEAAETDFLVTIDGDNIVDPAFFLLRLDPQRLQPETVLSWPGRNAVNDLRYGNGSIKCWSRQHLFNLAPRRETGAVDFVYNYDLRHPERAHHLDMAVPFATTYCNTTPFQAFRSAFREGVRLTSVRSDRMGRLRLQVWMSVGRDAGNGCWAIYGARLGALQVLRDTLPVQNINDYDWFETYWREEIAPRFEGGGAHCPLTAWAWSPSALDTASRTLARELQDGFEMAVIELDSAGSRAFKTAWRQDPLNQADRLGLMRRDGLGVAREPRQAARLFESGVMLGSSNAMVNLARALRQGELGTVDYRRSAELLLEARGCGNEFAEQRLAELEQAGFGWGVHRRWDAGVDR